MARGRDQREGGIQPSLRDPGTGRGPGGQPVPGAGQRFADGLPRRARLWRGRATGSPSTPMRHQPRDRGRVARRRRHGGDPPGPLSVLLDPAEELHHPGADERLGDRGRRSPQARTAATTCPRTSTRSSSRTMASATHNSLIYGDGVNERRHHRQGPDPRPGTGPRGTGAALARHGRLEVARRAGAEPRRRPAGDPARDGL
jgi:hypothetical protein